MSAWHAALDRGRWARARRETFIRDGYRCRSCGGPGRLECDHVKPLDKGGDPYALDNLQTLCRGCHIAKTRGELSRPVPGSEAWRALVASLVSDSQ